jgi:hypothetical protein
MRFGKPLQSAGIRNRCWVPASGPDARFTVNQVRDIQVRPGKTAGGVDLVVRFAADAWAAQHMEGLDAAALDATLRHNHKWFANALTPEHIQDFFRTSFEIVDGGVEMAVRLSASSPPSAFVAPGEDLPDVDAWLRRWRRDGTRWVDVHLEVECRGILFEKTRFGLAYVLRSVVAEAGPRVGDMDRAEAEASLRRRVEASADAAVAEAERALKAATTAREAALASLAALEARASLDATWNAQYAALEGACGPRG